jgi:hypothetical protein
VLEQSFLMLTNSVLECRIPAAVEKVGFRNYFSRREAGQGFDAIRNENRRHGAGNRVNPGAQQCSGCRLQHRIQFFRRTPQRRFGFPLIGDIAC